MSGPRTRGHGSRKIEGAEESTEEWRRPCVFEYQEMAEFTFSCFQSQNGTNDADVDDDDQGLDERLVSSPTFEPRSMNTLRRAGTNPIERRIVEPQIC